MEKEMLCKISPKLRKPFPYNIVLWHWRWISIWKKFAENTCKYLNTQHRKTNLYLFLFRKWILYRPPVNKHSCRFIPLCMINDSSHNRYCWFFFNNSLNSYSCQINIMIYVLSFWGLSFSSNLLCNLECVSFPQF